MSFMIDGEQVVMGVHSSRFTHFKMYLIAAIMLAVPLALIFYSVKLPIPAAYTSYVTFVPIALAILLVILTEVSVRRSSSYITNYRVMTSKGIFKKTYESCTYDKIANIRVIQSFPQRLLRIGSIDISTVQKSEIMLSSIPNPSKVERAIYNIMEKSKNPQTSQRPSPGPPQQMLPSGESIVQEKKK
jgi:uncharacterized membrane protein YdbT with pleckstrin-like domain